MGDVSHAEWLIHVKSIHRRTDIGAMAHTSPNSPLAPTSRLFTSMAWGGLAVAAISMTSIVLFSIYHLLSGVVSTAGTAPTSRVWLIGVVALVVGAAASMLGFALGAPDTASRSPSETRSRPDLAA